MSWTSTYEAVEFGGVALHRMIAETAIESGDWLALIDGPTGQAVTYATLASRVERVAAGLAARGFGAGDVLALSAMAAGGTVTGANPSCTEGELARQLTDSGASVLVTVPSLLSTALSAAVLTDVREVVVLGEAEGATSILELLAADAPVPDVALDPATAVALLPYSSGTTGMPKGVMLTHDNLVTAVRQVRRGLRVTERDTLLAVARFFHIIGFVVNLAAPLASGATLVTMPRFDLERFLALIQEYHVTVLVGAPPIMAALARHPMVDAYDLSSLELIVSGGAPLGADLQRAVAAGRRAAVGQGWGMTETTVGATMPDREFGTVPGSVGRVMPNTELRVVDSRTGRDLGAGERGELWVRGPEVMAGYLNRPDATADIIDAGGWLRTGDLGYVDGNGKVFVVDRLKELIKVSAYQVALVELEALLITHPQVADTAVIPRPDASHGEIPVAVVVRRGELDGDELTAWVAERVAPYKRIRGVRFVEAVPRTPSGKLLRRVLIEQEQQTA